MSLHSAATCKKQSFVKHGHHSQTVCKHCSQIAFVKEAAGLPKGSQDKSEESRDDSLSREAEETYLCDNLCDLVFASSRYKVDFFVI